VSDVQGVGAGRPLRRPLRSPASVSAHLVRADPAFTAVVAAAGPFAPRPPSEDIFNALVRAITYQQLAGRAAAAIHGRLLALFTDALPTPTAVLATPVDTLRTCGLSGAKTAAILDLALKCADGVVPLDQLASMADEEVVARLSAVRGVGRWTAEMLLLFDLRRPDVWPVGDFAVRKGWALIHAVPEMPAPRELAAAGEVLRPHRSAAAWYCWRALDTLTP
jgi:DNA-3-methyladenine glycosylase II